MARTVSAYLAGAVGDDVAYTSEQFGHEDARFTLNVYTHAVKQRQRLSQAELVSSTARPNGHKWVFPMMGGAGLEPATSCL